MPHFDFRAKEAEELSGIDLIVYASLVRKGQEEAWEAYAWENQGYIEEEYEIRGWTSNPGNISKELYPYVDAEGNFVSIEDVSMHAPFWQSGPVPANASIINLDLYTNPSFKRMMDDVLEIKHEMLSEAVDLDFILKYIYSNYTDNGHPLSYILMPVFGGVTENASDVVGFLAGELTWQAFFVDVLPKGTKGILVDIYETCGSEFTYTIYGHEATFDGRGDLHDSRYDGMKRSYPFAEFARYDGAGEDASINHCDYTINIYPTVEFEESFYTSGPAIYTAVVVLVFVATACIFALYDYMVYRRQTKLLKTAQRTNQIVSSLFPSNVKQRILEEAEEQARREMEGKGSKTSRLGANTVAEFLGGQPDDSTQTAFETKPIADLFPSVTVMVSVVAQKQATADHRQTIAHSPSSSVRGHCWFHSVEFDARTESGVYSLGDHLP